MAAPAMNVLVVDDDPLSRRAVSQTLESAGYRIHVASGGEEGLGRLRQSNLQLVVCDWNMPGMNGLELCRAIRATRLQRYVYILMLTSHNRPQDTIEGLAAGADDYVAKPFNPVELVLRINTGRRIVRSESSGMTIFALAKLAESRDRETGSHLERVRSYCYVLAQALRRERPFQHYIDDEYLRLLYDTSPLHDIGKVAIPDAILLKPGPLTDAEFEVMKTHTTHGAATLAAAMGEFPHADFLRMAHNIALYHHERYDGRGYPYGLAGDAIPLCGRLVALADVYDALTSRRVYKDAISHAETCKIIRAESGAHFDPLIVEAFCQAEDQFAEIHRRFADDAPAALAAGDRLQDARDLKLPPFAPPEAGHSLFTDISQGAWRVPTTV